MYLQIAWRNIWRNPRRTTVIMLAVIIGVWNMIFLGALQRGTENGMIKNGISTLTGHIQIHHKGYRNDPVIENSITDPDPVNAVLDTILPPEAVWTSRVRVNAVVSNARHTSGATLLGIDPDQEAGVSFIGHACDEHGAPGLQGLVRSKLGAGNPIRGSVHKFRFACAVWNG